ncbi:hypothetical protein BDQ17DRAFT_1360555, partial [Cyathus striatus]
PMEVLEHIAFFVATDGFLGPPISLPPLLATNHRIHDPRFGEERLSSTVLAHELQRRCLFLKRIQQRIDSTLQTPAMAAEILDTSPEELLFQAYLMVTENIRYWLRQYWFDELGASRAIPSMSHDAWPPNDRRTSLAMWLFWFMLRSVDYPSNDEQTWTALNTLRVFALAAHKYYGKMCDFTPPPLATPAILSFLTLVNKLSQSVTTAVPLPPSDGPVLSDPTSEWSCEMYRCLSLGSGKFSKFLTKSFKPGSLEGVWEGLFTYTEFTAYAALLAGAPPPVLQKSMVLLGAGDPLRSYFPTGTQITEHRDGIEVREPGSCEPIRYRRPLASACRSAAVLDVIVTGEGHSAWGQFNLVGRVRPCDGFISLSKEYVC